VDAILNGKKIELSGDVDEHQLLLIAPGDYRAMLSGKSHFSDRDVLFQRY